MLGCGNVGAALVTLVAEQAGAIEARTGLRLEIASVAVRNLSRERDVELPETVLTRDSERVVADPDIDLIVEVIGGIEPARQLILSALKNGKPVVTANKELLANVGAELFGAAAAAERDLLFEAAVAGGIPHPAGAARERCGGEPIDRVMGIVNGTTNYILTRMTEDGADYGVALAEAQRLGYAERDPTADVEGYDAAAKAAIIATIAFGARVVAGDVYHEGISRITADDIAVARRLGYVVKLLAIAEAIDGAVAVRVHPAMVPNDHPLASVRDSYNAVFVEGGAVGRLMFYGRGAGGRPTASAVLGDLIDAAVNLRHGTHGPIGRLARTPLRPMDDTTAEYYLPLEVADRPGVLHAVTGVFAKHGVSIRTAEQEGRGDEAQLVFITHEAREADVQATLPRPARPRGREAGRRPAPRDRRLTCATSRRVGPRPSSGSPTSCSTGLASDGGLYVPEVWPALPPVDRSMPYADAAAAVVSPFIDDEVEPAALHRMCTEAYATFDHPAVCPLVQIGPDDWLLELFHGPTLAFKDVALQLVGRLFDDVLGRRGERLTVVAATSGDTGSAAIDAVAGRDNVEIVVLYPEGRVSDVQRRQMTTVDAPNVHTVAIEGTFDDCQDLVKAMFADEAFRRGAPARRP